MTREWAILLATSRVWRVSEVWTILWSVEDPGGRPSTWEPSVSRQSLHDLLMHESADLPANELADSMLLVAPSLADFGIQGHNFILEG